MNGIVKIIESLKDQGVLIDDVTEIIKNEIEKQKSRFLDAVLAPLASIGTTYNFFSKQF